MYGNNFQFAVAFNSNLPADHSQASAAQMRGQLNGLKDLIDAQQIQITAQQATIDSQQAQLNDTTLQSGDNAAVITTLQNAVAALQANNP